MNLKKAIADWLLNNPTINNIIWDRVYRNKANIKDNTPLIVYVLQKTTNQLWGWNNIYWYLGYYVDIDIIWKYEEQEEMEQVRQEIKEKLSWFNWELTIDWKWIISLIDIIDLYDEKTDYIVYRITLLFKEKKT